MILLRLKVHIALLLKSLQWLLITFKEGAKVIIVPPKAICDLRPYLFLSFLTSCYFSPCGHYSRPKKPPCCYLNILGMLYPPWTSLPPNICTLLHSFP